MIIVGLLLTAGIIYLVNKNEELDKEMVLVPVKDKINPQEIIRRQFLNGQIDEKTYYEISVKIKE